jgi:hypothetical protein
VLCPGVDLCSELGCDPEMLLNFLEPGFPYLLPGKQCSLKSVFPVSDLSYRLGNVRQMPNHSRFKFLPWSTWSHIIMLSKLLAWFAVHNRWSVNKKGHCPSHFHPHYYIQCLHHKSPGAVTEGDCQCPGLSSVVITQHQFDLHHFICESISSILLAEFQNCSQ